MLRHINAVNRAEITVGVVQPKTHVGRGGNVDMAALYRFHEEGTTLIPKRSTLRPAISGFNYESAVRQITLGAAIGAYPQALSDVGDQLAREVKLEIMRIKTPPLKPSTIAQRVNGGANPLVDTGQLLRAIGHKVKL